MPTCIFCGNAKVSKEHLWGKWLKKYFKPVFDPEERQKHTVSKIGEDGKIVKAPGQFRNSGHALSTTTKIVCETCNNTWMSEIESNMDTTFKTIFHGRREKLDQSHVTSLSNWAYLKALIHISSDKPEHRYLVREDQNLNFSFNLHIARENLDKIHKESVDLYYKTRKIPEDVRIYALRSQNEKNNGIGAKNTVYSIRIDWLKQLFPTYIIGLYIGQLSFIVTNMPKLSNHVEQHLAKAADEATAIKTWPANKSRLLRDIYWRTTDIDIMVRGAIPGVKAETWRPYWDCLEH